MKVNKMDKDFFNKFPKEFYDEKSEYYITMNDSLIREFYIILMYKQYKLGDKLPKSPDGENIIPFSIGEITKLLRIGTTKAKNTLMRLELLNLIKIIEKDKDNYQVALIKPNPAPKDLKEYYEKEIADTKKYIKMCSERMNRSDDVKKKNEARIDCMELSIQLNDLYDRYIKELKK